MERTYIWFSWVGIFIVSLLYSNHIYNLFENPAGFIGNSIQDFAVTHQHTIHGRKSIGETLYKTNVWREDTSGSASTPRKNFKSRLHTPNHAQRALKHAPHVQSSEGVASASRVRHCTNEERKEQIRNACQKLYPHLNRTHVERNWPTSDVDELKAFVAKFYVDDAHKVLMCTHPKVASSSLTVVMRANSVDDVPFVKLSKEIRNGVRTLMTYDKEEILHRLKTYYKASFVRHPYDRLESMYSNKFVNRRHQAEPKPFWVHASKEGLKSFNVSIRDATLGDLVDLMELGYENMHWDSPYDSICHYCQVPFDFIGKLETYQADAGFLVNEKLLGKGLDTQEKAERIATIHNALGRDGRALQYFSNLTDRQLDYLDERLKTDMDMFGYEFEREGFKAKCRNFGSGEFEKECC